MPPPLIIILAVFVYGLVHSWLASLEARAIARRQFGPPVDRVYRLAYNFFASLTLLPVLVLPLLLPDRHLYTITFPWVLLTLTIQVVALVGLVIGLLQTGAMSFLGLRQLVDPPDASPPQLVVQGLYRWVRHPLYTAGLLFIWPLPVMTVNLLTLNIGLTVYILIGALFEERKLLREFGEAYVEYCRRTPMLIPGFRIIRDADSH